MITVLFYCLLFFVVVFKLKIINETRLFHRTFIFPLRKRNKLNPLVIHRRSGKLIVFYFIGQCFHLIFGRHSIRTTNSCESLYANLNGLLYTSRPNIYIFYWCNQICMLQLKLEIRHNWFWLLITRINLDPIPKRWN